MDKRSGGNKASAMNMGKHEHYYRMEEAEKTGSTTRA